MISSVIQSLRPLVHPMLVHFPIALLFASVALDWMGFWLRRPGLTRAGFYVLVFGTAGAGVAAVSGPDHASGGPAVQELLTSHQSFALITVALAVTLMVVRFAAIRGIQGRWALGYLASTLLLLVTLSLTGYYGGELTYHQGVGVATATPASSGTGIASAGDGEAGGTVPAKPLVVLLGLFSVGVLGFWIVAGRSATGGYFAAWWQAVRRDSDDGGALWTLRQMTSAGDGYGPMPRAAAASEPHGDRVGRSG